MKHLWLMIVLLIAVAAAGVIVFARPKPTTSGITGTVTIGPTCPVQRIDMPDQCADKPYQTTLLIQNQSQTRTLAKTATNQQGQFNVSLAPGIYWIVPNSANHVPPIGRPMQVTVKANTYTTITYSFDSGIR